MIYLDNNATTKTSDLSTDAILNYMQNCYYNSSSTTAAILGADKPRQIAADVMAKLLNAEDSNCFVFTSGATESNNWVFHSIQQANNNGRLVISAIEHTSISEPAAFLARKGFEVVEIPVDSNGTVLLDSLDKHLSEDTLLVSVMLANNETGILEPLPEIGELIRKLSPKALFHTDATQAIGKIPIDLQNEMQEIDLLSFSSHKHHGPKGIGGLYIRPGVDLHPLLRGGGQESGLRAGTTNTPALAGLAAAITEVNYEDMRNIKVLRDSLELALLREIPSTIIHSKFCERLPNTSCVSFPGHIGDDIAIKLASNGIIVGIGSACSGGSLHPPKTLLAMGVEYSIASSSIRFSLSRFTKEQDIYLTVSTLKEILSAK